MEDKIEYVSGPYQQFTEEPRMQELDIIQEKEEPVEIEPITRPINKNRAKKNGTKSKKNRTKSKKNGTKTKKNGGKSKRKYKY